MTRRDQHFDALLRQLGAAYYQAVEGQGSAAEVSRAVSQVAASTADAGDRAGRTRAVAGPSGRRHSGRWRVRDVMTDAPVCAAEHTGYKQLARLLGDHQVGALPVVSSSRKVLGIVSEADLLRRQAGRPAAGRPRRRHGAGQARAETMTAAGLMTAPAITIHPDAPVSAAARLMTARGLRRLPVVAEDGRLIGIVTRRDLLSVFLRPDAEIVAEARAVLTDVLLITAPVAVRAREGVVTLRGELPDASQIPAARRLISEIDGVVAVRDNLSAGQQAPSISRLPG